MSKTQEIKYILRALVLEADERKRVHEIASFFMLKSNSGDSDIKISIDNDPLSDCPVGYQYNERKEDSCFSHIDFMNPNVGQVTIEYVMSIGLVQSSPTISGIENILEEMQGLTSGEIWGTEKTIGVAAAVVMAVNTSRHSGSVQAKSTNNGKIYIGYDNSVVSTKWIAELQAGQSYSFDDWRGTIFAIASAAGQLLGYGEH